jgi:hypothetical protein
MYALACDRGKSAGDFRHLTDEGPSPDIGWGIWQSECGAEHPMPVQIHMFFYFRPRDPRYLVKQELLSWRNAVWLIQVLPLGPRWRR